jgi:hypothetical protein
VLTIEVILWAEVVTDEKVPKEKRFHSILGSRLRKNTNQYDDYRYHLYGLKE